MGWWSELSNIFGMEWTREMCAAAPAWRLQDGLLVSGEVGCGWALNSRQFQHEDCRISDDWSVKGTSHSQIILVHCSTIFFYDISQFWISLGYEPKFLPPFQRHFQFLSGTSKASKSRQSCITSRPHESLIASVRSKKVFQGYHWFPSTFNKLQFFSCIVGTESSEVREFLCQNRQCGTTLEPGLAWAAAGAPAVAVAGAEAHPGSAHGIQDEDLQIAPCGASQPFDRIIGSSDHRLKKCHLWSQVDRVDSLLGFGYCCDFMIQLYPADVFLCLQ